MSVRPAWWHHWASLGACIAIAGLVLLLDWYAERGYRDRLAQFQADGVTVIAEVRRKQMAGDPQADKRIRYVVLVRYTDLDGRTFLAESFVSAEFYDRIRPGDRVTFQYLPEEPRRWMLDPEHGNRDSAMTWVIVCLLTGCGIYNFFSIRRRYRAQGDFALRAR